MTDNQFKYIIDTFRSIYNIPEKNNLIYHGKDEGIFKGVIIVESNFATSVLQENTNLVESDILYAKWMKTEIPFLLDKKSDEKEEIITVFKDRIRINFDIISAAFYLLSGWQEKQEGNLDIYGRFKHSSSIQNKLGFTRVPLVNYYFDILKTALEKYLHTEIRMKNSSLVLTAFITHDVDIMNTIWLEDIMSCVRAKRFRTIPSVLLSGIKKLGSKSLINSILELEKQLSVKSTFFFLGRKGKSGKIKCADYRLNSSKVRNLIESIRKYGSEASIHGSPGSETDFEKLIHELEMISPKPCGNRFHFLMFNIPTTVKTLQSSGVKYDSTLGFAEDIGFRNSFCHPFYLYDIESDKPTDVIEFPLNVMDTTLKRVDYLGDGSDSLENIRRIVDETDKFGGVFTLLWHNNYFSEIKHSGFTGMYSEIIDYLKTREAQFLTGSEIHQAYIKE